MKNADADVTNKVKCLFGIHNWEPLIEIDKKYKGPRPYSKIHRTNNCTICKATRLMTYDYKLMTITHKKNSPILWRTGDRVEEGLTPNKPHDKD